MKRCEVCGGGIKVPGRMLTPGEESKRRFCGRSCSAEASAIGTRRRSKRGQAICRSRAETIVLRSGVC